MSIQTGIQPLDRSAWARLATDFRDHNYRQAWAFAEASAARVGATSEHVALYESGALRGLADVRVRRLPLGVGGIAYVNGGPLVRREGNDEDAALRASLRLLVEEYVKRRKLLLRVQTPVGDTDWNERAAAALAQAGLQPTPGGQPYRTFLLDLSPPLEILRKQLRQKWRNGLNRAGRSGLTLRSGHDAALFDTFLALFESFSERKSFEVDLPPEFYAARQPEHLEAERYRIILADQDGEAVAGHVSSLDGDTCVYLLGATLPSALKTNAAYLLQWRAIEIAKERGARWYDLGGIDPEGNPGVFHFKRGLNGLDVQAAGPSDIAPPGPLGALPRLGESVYRRMRKGR